MFEIIEGDSSRELVGDTCASGFASEASCARSNCAAGLIENQSRTTPVAVVEPPIRGPNADETLSIGVMVTIGGELATIRRRAAAATN